MDPLSQGNYPKPANSSGYQTQAPNLSPPNISYTQQLQQTGPQNPAHIANTNSGLPDIRCQQQRDNYSQHPEQAPNPGYPIDSYPGNTQLQYHQYPTQGSNPRHPSNNYQQRPQQTVSYANPPQLQNLDYTSDDYLQQTQQISSTNSVYQVPHQAGNFQQDHGPNSASRTNKYPQHSQPVYSSQHTPYIPNPAYLGMPNRTSKNIHPRHPPFVTYHHQAPPSNYVYTNHCPQFSTTEYWPQPTYQVHNQPSTGSHDPTYIYPTVFTRPTPNIQPTNRGVDQSNWEKIPWQQSTSSSTFLDNSNLAQIRGLKTDVQQQTFATPTAKNNATSKRRRDCEPRVIEEDENENASDDTTTQYKTKQTGQSKLLEKICPICNRLAVFSKYCEACRQWHGRNWKKLFTCENANNCVAGKGKNTNSNCKLCRQQACFRANVTIRREDKPSKREEIHRMLLAFEKCSIDHELPIRKTPQWTPFQGKPYIIHVSHHNTKKEDINNTLEKGQFTLKLIQFIQQLQGKGYTELVMYTNQNDWNGLVSRDSDEIFSHMPLWVYDFKETGLPDDIETWTSRGKTWKFWHFSNTTQIDGIYNCVNADVEQ